MAHWSEHRYGGSMRLMGPILPVVALLLAFASACKRPASLDAVVQDVQQTYADVPSVTPAQLEDIIKSGKRVQLLDVRARDEFAVSHLPGARWAAQADGFDGIDPAADLLVVYCSVGYRSGDFARALRSRGIHRAHNLVGGIFQWANQGRTLRNADGAATTVHGYSDSWSRLLAPGLRHDRTDPDE